MLSKGSRIVWSPQLFLMVALCSTAASNGDVIVPLYAANPATVNTATPVYGTLVSVSCLHTHAWMKCMHRIRRCLDRPCYEYRSALILIGSCPAQGMVNPANFTGPAKGMSLQAFIDMCAHVSLRAAPFTVDGGGPAGWLDGRWVRRNDSP